MSTDVVYEAVPGAEDACLALVDEGLIRPVTKHDWQTEDAARFELMDRPVLERTAGNYYRAMLAAELNVEKFREHSILLNKVCWRLSEALGDVPPGADSIEADDADVLAMRVVAILNELRPVVRRPETPEEWIGKEVCWPVTPLGAWDEIDNAATDVLGEVWLHAPGEGWRLAAMAELKAEQGESVPPPPPPPPEPPLLAISRVPFDSIRGLIAEWRRNFLYGAPTADEVDAWLDSLAQAGEGE